jgi:hypothetical protein
MHAVLTNEADGYYADYASSPAASLGRCLAQGFAYQGIRRFAMRRAAHRARICRPSPSSIFSRTTIKSAIAPSASG